MRGWTPLYFWGRAAPAPKYCTPYLRRPGSLHGLIRNRINSYESKYCTPPGAPPVQRYTWLRVCYLHPSARRPRVLAGAFPGLQYLFLLSTVGNTTPLRQSCLPRGRRVLARHSRRSRKYLFHYIKVRSCTTGGRRAIGVALIQVRSSLTVSSTKP